MAEDWDAVADAYHEEVAPFTGQWVSEIMKEFPPQRCLKVLDVGAGTGTLALACAREGHEVVAADISPEMCRVLEERAAGEGLTVSAVICEGAETAEAVPSAGGYDVAASSFGVIFFPSPGKGLEAMRRVVRPGGKVIATAWAGPSLTPAFNVIGEAVARAGLEGRSPRHGRISGTPQGLTSLFEGAGLTDVTCRPVTRTLVMPSAERYWRRMRRAAPGTRALLAGLDAAGAQAVEEETLALLKEQFGDGEVRLDATAFVVAGTRPMRSEQETS